MEVSQRYCCLRADVSYFPRATKEIGDVCTQATFIAELNNYEGQGKGS